MASARAEQRRYAGAMERLIAAGRYAEWEKTQYRAATAKVVRLEAAEAEQGDWATRSPVLHGYAEDLAAREQQRRDFLMARVQSQPSPELVTALGPRPSDREKAAQWDRAAGLTVAYEERWRPSRDVEPGPAKQSEQRALETAKRAWTALRDGVTRAVDHGLGR